MKRNIEIFTSVFVLVIIFFGSIIFISSKKIEFSEKENRYLTFFPKIELESIKESKFMREVENYTNDHFPLRNQLITIQFYVEKLLGKTKIKDIYLGKDKSLITPFEKKNDSEKVINYINKFVDNNDFNVISLIVPNKIAIYEDELPINNEEYVEKDEINKLYSSLNTININTYDSLIKNKNKYKLYFNTDHHWTIYGAFIAYNEYSKKMFNDSKNIKDYKIEVLSKDFLGTSHSKVNDPLLEKEELLTIKSNDLYEVNYVYENKVTNTLYNRDYLIKKDKYAAFLDNNHALIKITNKSNLGKDKILLVKNSYANSFVPFIVSNYKEVYVVDLRYFNKSVSELMKEENIENMLILYDINGLYSDVSIFKLK